MLGAKKVVSVSSIVFPVIFLMTASGMAATPVRPQPPPHSTGQFTRTYGTATSITGSNSDQGSQLQLNYNVPSACGDCSGTVTTTITDADGNTVYTHTGNIQETGSGGQMFDCDNEANVPQGGGVSISITESDGNGNSFSAGGNIYNFGT
jgi:hypothetical protein